ncbi:MAG: hypothetical protein HZB39_15040 [Planctomycetes bacterium]|nr:hypothetical protein [Planctomycetota bacterium]
MELPRLSFGIGDRFGQEGEAQLAAFVALAQDGVVVTPVWNKSNREHRLCGTHPAAVRAEADAAVAALRWPHGRFVDADHVGLATVEPFLASSDFFTIDVADAIGREVSDADAQSFAERHAEQGGGLRVPGLPEPLRADRDAALRSARKSLAAVREAGRVFRCIAAHKGENGFVAEVSMDETDAPQTPIELWFVLRGLAEEGVRVQTIAPRFSGAFHKGVDYAGDPSRFEAEFEADTRIVQHASRVLGLPRTLKLSVHSGSDKFALYPRIQAVLARTSAGVHVKTAGTTWLEELIGLAEAGGDGLAICRDLWCDALARIDELCAPYATVVAIDRARLPSNETVARWDGPRFARALRHDSRCPDYDRGLRQLLHVSFKLAAEMGQRFHDALRSHRADVARNVTHNLLERHLRPLFGALR